jgi:hypothetical protein
VRAALAGVLLAPLLLAACSGAEEPSADNVAAVAWNPCDGVGADQVSRIAGEPMVAQTGTAEQPRCVFTPETEGGPAYEVSYLWFDGGLDAALDSMGAASTRLRPVSVPDAVSARLAVRERESGILVTGFVQTDGLVQSVNAVQIASYDKEALVTSTTALLAALAREAPQE